MVSVISNPSRHKHRLNSLRTSGFSLFEVVLAIAILAGALLAIGSLMESARLAVSHSTAEVEALTRCESLIDELVLGFVPLSETSEQPFEDNEDWTYSITIQPTDYATMQFVSATVMHTGSRDQIDAEVTLNRIIATPIDSSEEGL